MKIEHINESPSMGAVFTVDENNEVVPLDFTSVVEEVMDAVVHIKSTLTSYSARTPQHFLSLPDPFGIFSVMTSLISILVLGTGMRLLGIKSHKYEWAMAQG